MTSTLETITNLVNEMKHGSDLADATFYAMHAQLKPFQSWKEPTMSNLKEDWALRLPADIRALESDIRGRTWYHHSVVGTPSETINDQKLADLVARYSERYDALIPCKDEVYQSRVTVATWRELHRIRGVK